MSNRRKSSEELIREARGHLSETATDPEVESATSEVPEPIEQDAPEEAVHEHRYRSQIPDPPADQGPVSPIEYNRPSNPWIAKLIGVGVVVAIGLAISFFIGLDDASRSDTGEIVEAGDLDVMTIREGDCFDDPAATDVVFSLDAIPCSQAHDNEVFAVESVVGLWSDYPGQSAIDNHAYDVCSGNLFDDFVGTPYLDSALEVFTLTPTPESWAQGDREVVCALYRLDFEKLTGTARNSGL